MGGAETDPAKDANRLTNKTILVQVILKFWVNENMKSFYTIAFLIFVVCCLIYVEESVGPSTDAGS